MAEKKFFVDINLQGSALTNAKIGTNTGIGSTEGAFGYDSSAHRLQYFDGTATKDVANLSDIAAVTGGLIFQGGYDPTTNTPDITDGSALKGFFWAVTAAGTFLGESVQVGDSIVAKVDNAGATLSDWLILQGNIVIATDEVDGIVRLATDEEANAGELGGAVVITPRSLQHKVDTQITPEINSKVSKSGDTMSGNLDMGDNNINNIRTLSTSDEGSLNSPYLNTDNIGQFYGPDIKLSSDLNAQNLQKITNLPTPTDGGDATNKTYVDDQDALKVSKSGDTMSGNLNMGGNNINGANMVEGSTIITDAIDNLSGPISVYGPWNYGGYNHITNLGTPVDGGDAANKDYVDGQVATALPLAGGTMTGSIDMGLNDITNVNTLKTLILTNDDPENGIIINKDLDFHGVTKATNLPAPTDGGDATNKTYVDGVGATAESNANAYADSLAPNYDAAGAAATAESNANDNTALAIAQEVIDRNNAIKAQSYSQTIAPADWQFNSNPEFYYVDINHNLGNFINVSTFAKDQYGNYFPAEFSGEYNPTSEGLYGIYSNIAPTYDVLININKAGGNL